MVPVTPGTPVRQKGAYRNLDMQTMTSNGEHGLKHDSSHQQQSRDIANQSQMTMGVAPHVTVNDVIDVRAGTMAI